MSEILRPTVAEVDLGAIAQNIQRVIQKVSPAMVMAVIKANAYGHGDLQVADIALRSGVQYLGVATSEEGIRLRQAGINKPVLVLGSFFEQHAEAFVLHDLQAAVQSFEQGAALSEQAVRHSVQARFHLKVDTGMGRLGIHWQNAIQLAKQIASLPNLQFHGIFTHFACSDWQDKTFTFQQIARFEEIIAKLRRTGFEIPIVHAANSGAILDLPESYFDLVRLGIAMYGYYPSSETSKSIALIPALTLKSQVMLVKKVEQNESVSYNRTFIARHDTCVAVVPIGYGDGYSRLLSNRAHVLINGKRFPVIGTVCMDQIMVDVGRDSDIGVGDEVVLMGRQQDSEISAYELAELRGTIPYEVMTTISQRVPRIYPGYS